VAWSAHPRASPRRQGSRTRPPRAPHSRAPCGRRHQRAWCAPWPRGCWPGLGMPGCLLLSSAVVPQRVTDAIPTSCKINEGCVHEACTRRAVTHKSQYQALQCVLRPFIRHSQQMCCERNLRSKIWWFTKFCNSHYVSQFASFFIVTRTEIPTVKSCIWLLYLLDLTSCSSVEAVGRQSTPLLLLWQRRNQGRSSFPRRRKQWQAKLPTTPTAQQGERLFF